MITGYLVSVVKGIKNYSLGLGEAFYAVPGFAFAGTENGLETYLMSEDCGCGEACKNPKQKGLCQNPQKGKQGNKPQKNSSKDGGKNKN